MAKPGLAHGGFSADLRSIDELVAHAIMEVFGLGWSDQFSALIAWPLGVVADTYTASSWTSLVDPTHPRLRQMAQILLMREQNS
jgi:hypothetical protein